MDMYEADMVYVLTSGFHKKADSEHVIREVTARNLKETPLQVIGIDCDMKVHPLDVLRLLS